MKREIKFRAFDDDRMIYPTGALSNIARLFRVIREDAILMQYTGLKDKNGKDIYEGDILTSGHESHSDKLTVVFENGGFCFANNLASGSDRLHQMRVGTMEVIGNIYQNAELLTFQT